MSARWKNFSEEQLKEIVKESSSNREVLSKLGYSTNGGSGYPSLYRMYKQLNIDTSHFKGQGWNKDNVNLDKYIYGSVLKNGQALRDLSILYGRKCQKCGLSEWNGQPIALEAHHVDGDHLNNALENLTLLCPNCHSQTPNYRIKNKRKEISDKELIEAINSNSNIREALISVGLTASGGNYARAYALMDKNNILVMKSTPSKNDRRQSENSNNKETRFCSCGNIIYSKNAKTCKECMHKSQRKIERPDRDSLKNLIRKKSFCEISRQFGVTDNAIRKWCDAYSLPRQKKQINSYSDEDWDKI